MSGQPRGTVPSSTAADVAAAVAAASRAFKRGEWAAASTAERARVLWRAAALLEAESGAFAAAESRDTGKPVRLAAAMDVPRAVANLRFFAGLVEHGWAWSCIAGRAWLGRPGIAGLACNLRRTKLFGKPSCRP